MLGARISEILTAILKPHVQLSQHAQQEMIPCASGILNQELNTDRIELSFHKQKMSQNSSTTRTYRTYQCFLTAFHVLVLQLDFYPVI